MNRIELSAGPLDYIDTGGTGPVLVLLHGLLMDATLWEAVIADLGGDFRCIAPTLPFGAHRLPVHDGGALSLAGIARLVAELLDRLDLGDVTLVGNDTGGAVVQLLAAERAPRIGRIVLASCDAFDNFPPGLTGKALFMTGKLPPALFGLFMQQMRLKLVRRSPIAFGWLTRRGDAACVRALRPIFDAPAIRRDTVRLLRALAGEQRLLREAGERLAAFDHPALVVWASEDRVMPLAHGRRLAALLPQGRLVEIADSDTLLPLDQPAALARVLRDFLPVGALPA
jgi:pimeloyl-ACP methyl ester carboxylesterase